MGMTKKGNLPMMKDHKTQIVVGIAVLILTFLLALQFKSVTLNNEANQTFNMRVDELDGF